MHTSPTTYKIDDLNDEEIAKATARVTVDHNIEERKNFWIDLASWPLASNTVPQCKNGYLTNLINVAKNPAVFGRPYSAALQQVTLSTSRKNIYDYNNKVPARRNVFEVDPTQWYNTFINIYDELDEK